jgi:hypothetical protein
MEHPPIWSIWVFSLVLDNHARACFPTNKDASSSTG